MARKKIHNYAFLDNFSYYVPDVAGLMLLLCFLFLGILLGNVATLVCVSLLGEAGTDASLLISYPLIFIPAMIYASAQSAKLEGRVQAFPVDAAHFAPLGGFKCALIAMILTLAASYVSEYFITLLPPIPEWLKKIFEQMTGGNIILNFICVSIFAPFFEEWLCRGTVLRSLLHFRRGDGRGISPAWAIVISAAFFAIIHLNPWQAIAAFVLGLIFGYVYYKTGSLKLTMLMHFTNNTAALLLSRLPGVEAADTYADLLPASLYWIIYACCVIIIVLSILAFRKVHAEETEIEEQ